MLVGSNRRPIDLRRMKQLRSAGVLAALVVSGFMALTPSVSFAQSLPEIRLSAANPVPACVTPDRLMAFLKKRNGNLDPRFRTIASYYKKHGEAWGVRWDYAFFQMAIETNFLSYRAPNGRMGDVDPKQNNFAGIGTTGGGVPGDSFPDVSTGVLGQIQHLVAYSGEMVAEPVAPRTRLKQEHILEKSRELNRPVRFSDLAKRWAVDPKYAKSIEWVAGSYRSEFCRGRNAAQQTEVLPSREPSQRTSSGAPPARVIAVADTAEVHTIWKRDDAAKASPPKAKAVATAAPKAAAAPAKPVKSAVEAPLKKRAAKAMAAAPPKTETAPAPAAAQAQVEADVPKFALFAPPAALAGVKVPSAAPSKTVAPVQPQKLQAKPVKHRERLSETKLGPPPPPPGSQAMGSQPTGSVAQAQQPLALPGTETGDQPKAVSGKTVAGFMVGGAAQPDFPPPSGLGVKPGKCVVETARFGGDTTVLVKASEGQDVHYVALSVLDGFEESMTKTFLSSRAEGGEVVGTFATRDEALTKARTFCPD
jgi:hypothetical protein